MAAEKEMIHFICLNDIYIVCVERDAAIAGLISSQSSYTSSLSIFAPPLSLSPALCHSFFFLFSLSFSLYISTTGCEHSGPESFFTALLKAPLNGEIPNTTASCSHITHFTAFDAGSVSSNTQRCCCMKINL